MWAEAWFKGQPKPLTRFNPIKRCVITCWSIIVLGSTFLDLVPRTPDAQLLYQKSRADLFCCAPLIFCARNAEKVPSLRAICLPSAAIFLAAFLRKNLHWLGVCFFWSSLKTHWNHWNQKVRIPFWLFVDVWLWETNRNYIPGARWSHVEPRGGTQFSPSLEGPRLKPRPAGFAWSTLRQSAWFRRWPFGESRLHPGEAIDLDLFDLLHVLDMTKMTKWPNRMQFLKPEESEEC